MINVKPWNMHTKIQTNLSKSDTQIKVAYGDGVKFAVPDTDHFYATIMADSRREFVKVVARDGDVLTVERGQDGTAPLAFFREACLIVEWNPAQLCEYVHTCMTGESSVITPQTICTSTCTCFDVDEMGRITRVDGSVSC